MIAHLLNRDCEITPVSVGSWTDDGGFATEEGTVINTVCRLFPLGAAEREELARREVEATHVIYLLPGIDVKRGYMIQLPDGKNPEHTLYVEYVQVASETDLYQRVVVSSTAESGAYGGEIGLRDVLIAETTVANAATLDVGDINAAPLHTSYNALLLVIDPIIPVVNGNRLKIRFGGDGSWWSSGYYYSLKTWGPTDDSWNDENQSQIICWRDSPTWNQGNNYNLHNLYGDMSIALKPELYYPDYGFKAEFRWGRVDNVQYAGQVVGRCPTTANLTAGRLYYQNGNITGTARLWGKRKP